MISGRAKRVGSLLKSEISGMIQKGLIGHGSCIITITEVIPTADLRTARVFVSIFGEEAESQARFNTLVNARSTIRKELFGKVRLRYIPELEFIKDNSIADGDRVLRIFSALEQEKQGEADKENS